MVLIERATSIRKAIIIQKAESEDFKLLTKRRFSFSWKALKGNATIYKLQIVADDDILGAIGLIEWPTEKRIEIKLLASSVENVGKTKIYEGIAGSLIAFTCRMAVKNYGIEACVSLVPKTGLIEHYMRKYYMKYGGWQLYIEGDELFQLLEKYSL